MLVAYIDQPSGHKNGGIELAGIWTPAEQVSPLECGSISIWT